MKYRNHLPQLNGTKMITDGGLETVLVFHEEIDLPVNRHAILTPYRHPKVTPSERTGSWPDAV